MPYKLNIGDGEHFLKWDGEALFVKGLVSLDALSVLNANIGNITAGNIRGTRFQVGGGTNEDIYFEDSGIRLYDAGGSGLIFYKAGLQSYFINMVASVIITGGIGICRIEYYSDNKIILNLVSKAFTFYPTGTLQLPNLSSAPTGHTGDLAFDDSDEQTKLYAQGAWRKHYTYANW